MASQNSRMILPREHGSWFMLLIPFFIGAILTHITWQHILLLFAVLFAFLAMTPAQLWVKSSTPNERYQRWFYQYLGFSALFGVGLLAAYPRLFQIGLLAGPFFLIHTLFIKLKKERHLLNDLAGIIALNLSLFASYYVGKGTIDRTAYLYLALLVPFYFGSALHIKSLIREKHNPLMRRTSLFYNALLPLLYVIAHVPWLLVIGCLITSSRILIFTPNSKFKIMTIGISEIISAILFGLFFIWAFWPYK